MVPVEEVDPGALGDGEHRGRLPQRRFEDGAEVKALLPGDLGRSQPEREVVDEDRGGRSRPAAPRRARPVRVEDRVAVERSLDRRQPAKLQRNLVPIRREQGVAFEVAQAFGSLSTAQQRV